MRMHLATAAIAMALGIPVRADFTGNEMLRYCTAIIKQAEGKEVSAEESMGALIAVGYLAGFTDSHAVETKLSDSKRPLYCLPEKGAENEQLARIIQKHLAANPESLHKNARIEIAIALKKAFPCSEK